MYVFRTVLAKRLLTYNANQAWKHPLTYVKLNFPEHFSPPLVFLFSLLVTLHSYSKLFFNQPIQKGEKKNHLDSFLSKVHILI